MSKKQLTGAALTAKIIKKRLSTLYPRVKFSVTSSVFSMGDSVDIRWTDGPMTDAVNAITSQYQHGNFDSMEDIYNYKDIDPSLGCDGAKYVHCNRTISTEHKAMLVTKAKEYYGTFDQNDNNCHSRLTAVERMFFPYPEARQKLNHIDVQGYMSISDLEIEIIKDVDTRNNSGIYVVKVKTRVDDFNSLRQLIGSFGGYYSRFKRGFIFKEDPTEKLNENPEDINTDIKD